MNLALRFNDIFNQVLAGPINKTDTMFVKKPKDVTDDFFNVLAQMAVASGGSKKIKFVVAGVGVLHVELTFARLTFAGTSNE